MSLCLQWGFPKHPVPIHSCHSRHSQTALSTWPALAFEGAYRSRGRPSMQTNKETDQRAQETSNEQWKWQKKNKQLIKEEDDQGNKVEQTSNQTTHDLENDQRTEETSPQLLQAAWNTLHRHSLPDMNWGPERPLAWSEKVSNPWEPLGDNLMGIVGWTTRLREAAVDERADGLELLSHLSIIGIFRYGDWNF